MNELLNWSDIERHELWSRLSPSQQREAREKYYQQYILPRKPEELSEEEVRSAWMEGYDDVDGQGVDRLETLPGEIPTWDDIPDLPLLGEEEVPPGRIDTYAEMRATPDYGWLSSPVDRRNPLTTATGALRTGALTAAGGVMGLLGDIYGNPSFRESAGNLANAAQAARGVGASPFGREQAIGFETDGEGNILRDRDGRPIPSIVDPQSNIPEELQWVGEMAVAGAEGGLESIPAMVGYAARGGFPGLLAGTYSQMSGTRFNEVAQEEFDKATSEGLSVPEASERALALAREHAYTSSALQLPFEVAPWGRMLRRMRRAGKGDALDNIGTTMFEEAVAEPMGGSVIDAYDVWARGKEAPTLEQFLSDRAGEIVAGAAGGLTVSGTIQSGASGVDMVRQMTGVPAFDAGVESVAPTIEEEQEAQVRDAMAAQALRERQQREQQEQAQQEVPSPEEREAVQDQITSWEREKARREEREKREQELFDSMYPGVDSPSPQEAPQGSTAPSSPSQPLPPTSPVQMPLEGLTEPSRAIEEEGDTSLTQEEMENAISVLDHTRGRRRGFSQRRVEAQGEAIRQLLEEGYTPESPGRNERYAEIMADKGFSTNFRSDVAPEDAGILGRIAVDEGDAPQAPTAPPTLSEMLDPLRRERDAATAANDDMAVHTDLQRHIESAINGNSPSDLIDAVRWGKDNGRPDISRAALTQLQRLADLAEQQKPGVSKDHPKYAEIEADLQRRAREARKQADDAEADLGEIDAAQAPTEPSTAIEEVVPQEAPQEATEAPVAPQQPPPQEAPREEYDGELSFLNEPVRGSQERIAARGEVIREMQEEGWTGSNKSRREEISRRMRARGFEESSDENLALRPISPLTPTTAPAPQEAPQGPTAPQEPVAPGQPPVAPEQTPTAPQEPVDSGEQGQLPLPVMESAPESRDEVLGPYKVVEDRNELPNKYPPENSHRMVQGRSGGVVTILSPDSRYVELARLEGRRRNSARGRGKPLSEEGFNRHRKLEEELGITGPELVERFRKIARDERRSDRDVYVEIGRGEGESTARPPEGPTAPPSPSQPLPSTPPPQTPPEGLTEPSRATREPESPVDVIDSVPDNMRNRVEALGEVMAELREEGWAENRQGRRAEIANRMTERGFPMEALPDVTRRTERDQQQVPVSVGSHARVFNPYTKRWSDARVDNVNTQADEITVSFRDGSTAVLPTQEVELSERIDTPSWIREGGGGRPSPSPRQPTQKRPTAPRKGQREARSPEQQAAEKAESQRIQRAERDARMEAVRRLEGNMDPALFRQYYEEERAKAGLTGEAPKGTVKRTRGENKWADWYEAEANPAQDASDVRPDLVADEALVESRAEEAAPYSDADTGVKLLDVLLDQLERTGKIPPRIRKIIEKLKNNSHVRDVKVVVVEVGDLDTAERTAGLDALVDNNNPSPAVYDPNNHTIYLKGNSWVENGLNPIEALHEVVHAATYNAIEGVKQGLDTNPETIRAVQDLENIMKALAEDSDSFIELDSGTRSMMEYATLDVHEFVAVVPSDPQVQTALKEKGLFPRFIDAVRRLLGLSRLDRPAIEYILDSVEQLIDLGDGVPRIFDGSQETGAIRTAQDANFGQEGTNTFNEGDYRPQVVSWAKRRWGEEAIAPNGNPIWQNFVAWFGDSQAVDADGNPVVIYHGTPEPGFETFHLNKERPGAYMSDNPSVAQGYTSESSFSFEGESTGGVYPLLASLQRPLVIDAGGRRWTNLRGSSTYYGGERTPFTIEQVIGSENVDTDVLVNALRGNDTYDGVIIRNVIDNASIDDLTVSDVYIVFDPGQVKSSIGNVGDFSPQNKSVVRSPSRREAGRTDNQPSKGELLDQLRARRLAIEKARDEGEVSQLEADALLMFQTQREMEAENAPPEREPLGDMVDIPTGREVLERGRGTAPESPVTRRMRQVGNAVRGLFSAHGVRGRDVDNIDQAVVKGLLAENTYLGTTLTNSIKKQMSRYNKSRKPGSPALTDAFVLRAMRTGNLSSLPKGVRGPAKEAIKLLQLTSLDAVISLVEGVPDGKALSKKQVQRIENLIASPSMMQTIFKSQSNPDYATRMIRNYWEGADAVRGLREEIKENGLDEREVLEAAQKGDFSSLGEGAVPPSIANQKPKAWEHLSSTLLVEDALDSVISDVLIPLDVAGKVEDGSLTRADLIPYHRNWVGTSVKGKSAEQLAAELDKARDDFIIKSGSVDENGNPSIDIMAMAALEVLAAPLEKGKGFGKMSMKSGGSIPAAVKALHGEIESPVVSYLHHLEQATQSLGHAKLLNRINELWTENGGLADARTAQNTVAIIGPEYGPMDGKFTTPRKKDVLDSLVKTNEGVMDFIEALASSDAEVVKAVAGKAALGVQSATSYLKAQQIIGNPANFLLNTMGAPEQLLASGNVPVINKTLGVQGVKRGINAAQGLVLIGSRSKINEDTRKIMKAGMAEHSQVAEIKGLLRRPKVRAALDRATTLEKFLKETWNLVRSGALTVAEVYTVQDLWISSTAYFKNEDDIRAHWDKVGKKYTEDELVEEAGRISRMSTIVMAQIPTIVRLTEKFGLTYVAPYLYAAHRSLLYNGYLGMAQTAEGLRTGDMDYARVGAARMIGSVAAATAFQMRMAPVYAAMYGVLSAFTGTMEYITGSDDEDDEIELEYIKSTDMFSDAHPVVMGRGEDGGIYVMDFNRAVADEPGRLSLEHTIELFRGVLSGDMDREEAARNIQKQWENNVFRNAPVVKAYNALFGENPSFTSELRRQDRAAYDTLVGNNKSLQRTLGVVELMVPSGLRNVAMEWVKDKAGISTPEEVSRLRELGFPIYELNAFTDATQNTYNRGISKYSNQYRDARREFKNVVGLLDEELTEAQIEAAYVEFAKQQLRGYVETLPTFRAAKVQGYSHQEIERAIKDNSIGLPTTLRDNLLTERFSLNTISDRFFESELDMVRNESRRRGEYGPAWRNHWENIFRERLHLLKNLRHKYNQVYFVEGSFKETGE